MKLRSLSAAAKRKQEALATSEYDVEKTKAKDPAADLGDVESVAQKKRLMATATAVRKRKTADEILANDEVADGGGAITKKPAAAAPRDKTTMKTPAVEKPGFNRDEDDDEEEEEEE